MPNPVFEDLASIVERHTGKDGLFPTAIPYLELMRATETLPLNHSVQEPALCVILQGRKRVQVADEDYVYDVDQYLLVSIDLPVCGQVVDVSPGRPYLALRMRIDAKLIAELLEFGEEVAPVRGRGIVVSRFDDDFRDCVGRLLRLLDTPNHIAAIAPLIVREIHYRLLTGKEGAWLRGVAMQWGSTTRVIKAIEILRRDYNRALRIEELASEVGLSPSALHHHFKDATAMSPLQYQKRLRLQEARRLILSEGSDAASAGLQVGYESPSQFSREYRRLFGAPPITDVTRLRGTVLAQV